MSVPAVSAFTKLEGWSIWSTMENYILIWPLALACEGKHYSSNINLADSLAVFKSLSFPILINDKEQDATVILPCVSSWGQVRGTKPLCNVEWLWIGFGWGLNLITSHFHHKIPKKGEESFSLKQHNTLSLVWCDPDLWPSYWCQEYKQTNPDSLTISHLCVIHNHQIIFNATVNLLKHRLSPLLVETCETHFHNQTT